MFRSLQLEVLERFSAVEEFHRNAPLKGDLAQTAKGLVFVQVYAIYEHTARSVVRLAIAKIADYGHRFSHLRPSLLSIFLDAELKSLRDCSDKHAWERRLELFERCLSDDPIGVVNAMPSDGSFYKHTQADLILKALGIRRTLTVRRRHPYRLDEIVNHRNSIAHGDETAREIGRRYSRTDVAVRIRLMKSICLRMIAIVAEHCDVPERHLR